MTTYTASATTDGWQLVASSTNGVTTYTLRSESGSSWSLGSDPAAAFKVTSTISDFDKQLLDGASGYKSVAINGKSAQIVAQASVVDTLIASIPIMVQQTARDIASQETVAAPAPAPTPSVTTVGFPPPIDSELEGAPPLRIPGQPISTPPIASEPLPPSPFPDAELKIEPVPVTINTVTLDANGKPVTTPVTINEPSPIRDPGELVINPVPVTINVATLNANGTVTTRPVTINEPPTVTNSTTGAAAPGSSSKYTVVKGDTLTAIAKKYGVPLADLIKANPQIKNPDLIYPGQVVNIPGKPSAADTTKPETGTTAPSSQPPTLGLSGNIKSAEGAATAQDQAQFMAREDWRVRLALSPGANFLYKAKPPGILQPLANTDGVIFPYTPAITVTYAANYEGTSLTHTNYRVYQYQNSSVDQVQITCEFTAQDVHEANYVLAVIHFFRSMTKMFYGQDSNPKNGTPPPLCYLYGMGGYQFDALPLVVSGFNYALPQDVDYIKTMAPSAAGTTQPSVDNAATNPGRLGSKIGKGGKAAKPNYGTTPTQAGESATWVPTKINISVTCLPVMSRNQVSNYFSLTDYATGELLQGTKKGRLGGGMW